MHASVFEDVFLIKRPCFVLLEVLVAVSSQLTTAHFLDHEFCSIVSDACSQCVTDAGGYCWYMHTFVD